MAKFKAFFNVTKATTLPETFVDDEMWLELDCDSMERASHLAFALFVKATLVEAQPMPVYTRIELDRIKNGREVKLFRPRRSHEHQ